MTEVWIILKNGLWILGLSVLLATWSYARYAAYEAGIKTRKKLSELKYALTVDLGVLLFIGGMAATETRDWARILWVVLGVAVGVQAYLQIRETHTPAEAKRSDQGDAPQL